MLHPAVTPAAPSERAKNTSAGRTSHVGQLTLKEICVLGSGYSGEVKCVQDEQGVCYALKVSNEKHIKFTMYDVPSNSGEKSNIIFHEAAEYEKLRKLYALGVPVPKPLAFQINTDASGLGTTSVLMELAKGLTLRDWLSERPGGKPDKLCGRSQHPAHNVADAVARIDVGRSIIAALMKLRRTALFSDFKPRNIMIDDNRHESSSTEKRFSTCLVDIGGVVLYQDVSTECNTENDFGRQKVIAFQPIKDRYLIETTCSYLSPEMALVISEYDFWKRRLCNHFFRTKKETYPLSQASAQYKEIINKTTIWDDLLKNGSVGTRDPSTKYAEMKVVVAYLNVRNAFRDAGILNTSIGDSPEDRLTGLPQPRPSDLVMVTEKASVFTMGLILVELFGGRRTGLTSLTRLRAVNDMFLGETGNAEFRMALEWEQKNPLLEEITGRTSLTAVPGKSNSQTYFDLYRKHAYPADGMLACSEDDIHIVSASTTNVKMILDSCLRFDPQIRPSLAELSVRLSELRHILVEESEAARACKLQQQVVASSSVLTAKRRQ